MENNPLLDVFVLYLMETDDISQPDVVDELHRLFSEIIYDLIENKPNINKLDFDIVKIKNNRVGFKVVPNNAISAFWLSGIFLDSTDEILPYMKFNVNGKLCWYDSKRKLLIIKINKNGIK